MEESAWKTLMLAARLAGPAACAVFREQALILCRSLARGIVSLPGTAARLSRWMVVNPLVSSLGVVGLTAFSKQVVSSALQILFKGLKNLYTWFRSRSDDTKPKIDFSPARTAFCGESIVAGSNEMDAPHRSGEIFIGQKDVVYGKGCRLYNHLVVPEHVLQACLPNSSGIRGLTLSNPKDTRLKQEFSIVSVDGEERIFEINSNFELIATDVLCAFVPDKIWSQLGVAKINVGFLDAGASVSITGIQSRGTIGVLTPCFASGFGQVRYGSTTTNGYSGAVYMQGQRAIGMHLWGGTSNLGVAMDYIRCLVSRLPSAATNESRHDVDHSAEWASSNWFTEDDKLRDGLKINNSSLDEIEVYYQGRYYQMDRDALKQNLTTKKWNALNYVDRESGSFLLNRGGSPLLVSNKESLNGPNTSGIVASSPPLKTSPVVLSKSQKKNLKVQQMKIELGRLKAEGASSSA
uniref:Uncharacterized protein n=1 Tax=Riboviria sp. TaxID=2585031 RepID=A0A8K1WNS9_9VIRU|nr:MAG: hypothetical protein 2 [Riboviria sp.]